MLERCSPSHSQTRRPSPKPSTAPGTCPTPGWPPPCSWRSGWAARSSWRAIPGVGKTALAQSLARITGAQLIRLQCYEGIDVHQALYDWDFPRQMLHLRAAAELGRR